MSAQLQLQDPVRVRHNTYLPGCREYVILRVCARVRACPRIAAVRDEVRDETAQLIAEHGEAGRPGLAVVLVGERPDSATYVKMKERAAAECGFLSIKEVTSAHTGLQLRLRTGLVRWLDSWLTLGGCAGAGRGRRGG